MLLTLSIVALVALPAVQSDQHLVGSSEFDHPAVSAVVLGVAQDAGYPQANCQKKCCELAWANASERKYVSCIAIIDSKNRKRFIFDCTPNFPAQLKLLDSQTEFETSTIVDGIFLTHAHMGHYTGLIHLGREAIGSKNVPVFGTKKMNSFLTANGPWNQLIKLSNITLNEIAPDQKIELTDQVSVTPFQVPHRDEFTDTVGFKIDTPGKSLVYLPDIDKWTKWDRSIEQVIAGTDYAMIDGSFFTDGEIPGRDMALIPHPFIEESISRFASLNSKQRQRIHFIHLNHTNPAIQFNGDPNRNSAARKIKNAGMNLARQGQTIKLN